MFKLFERQPNWALKQLVQETDQPAVCFSALFFFFVGGLFNQSLEKMLAAHSFEHKL